MYRTILLLAYSVYVVIYISRVSFYSGVNVKFWDNLESDPNLRAALLSSELAVLPS